MRSTLFLLSLSVSTLMLGQTISDAQMIGGMSGIGGGLGVGGGGGGGGAGCANQLVLDYSNSCALIGQAWGQ